MAKTKSTYKIIFKEITLKGEITQSFIVHSKEFDDVFNKVFGNNKVETKIKRKYK